MRFGGFQLAQLKESLLVEQGIWANPAYTKNNWGLDPMI